MIVSASAIALGTYAGGWRIIRTVGTRIIKMDTAQGFAAQGAGAAVILALLALRLPAVLDARHLGRGHRAPAPRSGCRRCAGASPATSSLAWVLTLPAAGVFGAVAYWVANAFGHGALGPLLVTLVSVGALVRAVAGRRERVAEAARAEVPSGVPPASAQAPRAASVAARGASPWWGVAHAGLRRALAWLTVAGRPRAELHA